MVAHAAQAQRPAAARASRAGAAPRAVHRPAPRTATPRPTRSSADSADAALLSTPTYLTSTMPSLASYDAMVCSMGDAATEAPTASRTEAPAAAAPRDPTAARSAARTASDATDATDSDSTDGDAAGGAGSAAGGAAGGAADGAAASAGGDAGAATGGAPVATRRRRGQNDEEPIEEPFVEVPIVEPNVGPYHLDSQALDRAGAAPPLRMPRYLETRPEAGLKDLTPTLRGYANAFAEAAGVAERLYSEVLAAGRAENEKLRSLYDQLQSDAQHTLDGELYDLESALRDARTGLVQAEADAVSRLMLTADNARKLIRTAARRAQGTVAARKGVIEGRIALARLASTDIENQLAYYAGEVDRAGPPASSAFTSLQGDPSPAHAPHPPATYPDYAPQMQTAENEPIDVAVPPRAADRATAFTTAKDVFAGNLATAHQSFQASAREAFQPFQHYIDQLGTAAPNQIATLRKNALKQVDRTEHQSLDGVRRSRNQIELGLVERYRRSREQAMTQSVRAAEGQRTSFVRAGAGQWQGYAGLASGQGAAIQGLADTIAGQRRQGADGFARFVVDSAGRTIASQRRMTALRLDQSTAAGERVRRQFAARSAQVTTGQERGGRQLAGQLTASAQASGASMMAQILALDGGLRHLAEPVAKSIDQFPVPAAAQLQAMEDTLWEKLGTAREQADAAYNGSTGPPSEAPTSSAPQSSQQQPPEGTGSHPHDFVTKADGFAAAPASEEGIVSLIRTISTGVVADVTGRGDRLLGQMTLLGQNPEQTIDCVRGLTYLRGQAVIRYYDGRRPGHHLPDDIATYMSFGNPITGVGTRIHSGNAVYNYLYGNNAAGALEEIQAATEWWNNGERVQQAMMNLSPADLQAMRGLPGAGAVLDSVEEDLEGADRRIFHILRNATAENAVQSAAAARAVRLGEKINEALETDPETGADAAFDLTEHAAQSAGSSRLEGGGEFGMAADYRYETPDQAEARRRSQRDAAWQETVARLGNNGERREDGAEGGVNWLRRTATRYRVYGVFDISVTHARPEQVRLLTNLAQYGAGAPETRAAQLAVEDSRAGGGKRERVEHALWDDDLADMANPDDPAAQTSRPPRPGDPTAMERARQRQDQMFRIYDRYRNPERAGQPGRTIEAIRADLGARLRAGHSDDPRLGQLLEMQATRGLTDPHVASLAFEHAVDRVGTDEQLLKDTLGRMSRDQIDAAVEVYNRTHTPHLYERLGVFGRTDELFPELSGDDRIQVQVMMMGRPRNDRERAEVSHMTSQLQRTNSTWVGRGLAGDESRRLDESHQRLLEMMGVSEGDAGHRSDFDSLGRLRFRNSGGQMVRVGRFDERGSFVPDRDHDGMEFAALMATNERNADAYREATDNIANAITTTVVVAAAVISTALTGGAAASFWIPVLSTAAAGLIGMGVNYAIKGGRYGYEDMGRDFALTVIQTATAGLAAGLTIARAGGMTALRGAMGARMISNAGFRTVTLAEEAVIGGAAGAVGGMGNAALDDHAWDNGEWLKGIGHGVTRGFAGGFASSLATGLTSRAVSLGAVGLGRMSGTASALNRGRVGDVASRFGNMRGRAWGDSFGVKLAARTLGGGLGAAASRATEIEYDRRRGAFHGGSAEGYDEIFAAGAQGGIQSGLEGVAEHTFEHHAGLNRWREAGMAARPPPEPGAHPPARAPPGEHEDSHHAGMLHDDGAVRTVDDPGGTRKPATPAGANPLVPTHVTIALTAADAHVVGHVTEGTVICHPDSKNPQAAAENFRALLAADPSREAAIFHNPVTGEYVVIQGGPREVAAVRPDGEMTGAARGRMVGRKGGSPSFGGHWLLEEHFHPNRPDESGTRLSRRLPSGFRGAVRGDFNAIEVESVVLRYGERRSRIHFDHEGTRLHTDFGISPGHPEGAYWIDFPHPDTGERVVRRFPTPQAYDEFLRGVVNNDSVGGAGHGVRTADPGGETPGTGRALARGSTETTLTAADQPVVKRLGEQLALNDHQRGIVAELQASTRATPDEIAAQQARLDARNARSRYIVRELGLVGEPESMARLHLLMNELSLTVPQRQMLADTVLEATRQHMILMGTLEPGEPLMLLLHGAPPERAASIREKGVQMAEVKNGAEDDFGRGLYLTTHVAAAEVYANKGGAPRGEIFPFMIRGRDFGPTVDVRPGGVHRAAWEAFVMRNLYEFDERSAFGVNAALLDPFATPAFGTFDAWGNRGTIFERFVEHLAATTGQPELAAPHLVLGELGGPMTSGHGGGDQQAVRHQDVADVLSGQMGSRRRGVAAASEPEPELEGAVRTADDDGMLGGDRRVRTVDGEETPPVAKTAAEEPAVVVAPAAEEKVAAPVNRPLADANPNAATFEGRETLALAMAVNMLAKPADVEMMTRLMERIGTENYPLIVDFMLSGGRMSWTQIEIHLQARGVSDLNSAAVVKLVARLHVINQTIGPQFVRTLVHLEALHTEGLPHNMPAQLHQYLLESPLILHMARTEPALLVPLFSEFHLNPATPHDPAAFESFIQAQFRREGLDPQARARLGAAFPWMLSDKSRSATPRANLKGVGALVGDTLGTASGARYGPAGDVPIGPAVNPFEPHLALTAPGVTPEAGMRVEHPVFGRGTVMEVSNGGAAVRFDTATANQPVGLNELFHARNPISGEPTPVVPLRTPGEGGTLAPALAEVVAFREKNALPAYERNDGETGTVAIVHMGNERFYGTNSTMPTKETHLVGADLAAMRSILRVLGLGSVVNSSQHEQFLFHAEFAALYSASLKMGTFPEVVEIFVDRKTCPFCERNLDAVATYFGIKELRVYYFDQKPPGPTLYRGRR